MPAPWKLHALNYAAFQINLKVLMYNVPPYKMTLHIR